jgi:membrane protein DedA with SNARE-associated domain
MTVETALIQYGYIALGLGTFFEGETILVIAGFLAHRGYLSLDMVIIAACAGSFCGDQLYFNIGRHGGKRFLARFPSFRKRTERFNRILEKHHTIAILSFRFFYGLRTVSPFAIGMSGVPAWKFFLLNLLSAAVWAAAIGSAGYFFGKGMEIIISDIKHYEIECIIVLAAAGILIFTAAHLLRKKQLSEKQEN